MKIAASWLGVALWSSVENNQHQALDRPIGSVPCRRSTGILVARRRGAALFCRVSVWIVGLSYEFGMRP
jgi:hypothetical protein